MGQGAAGKTCKLNPAFNEVAVKKEGKVKNRNLKNAVFCLYVLKGAVRKIAAKEFFVGKVNVLENNAACVQPDNHIVIFNVVKNFTLNVSRIRNVFQTVAVTFYDVAVLVKI